MDKQSKPCSSNPQRTQIFNLPIDKVSLQQAIEIIDKFIEEKKPHQVITLNSLMVNEAFKDQQFSKIIQRAELVLVDSVGIFWVTRLLGKPAPELIPGIDFLLELCKISVRKKFRLYLLGGKRKIIEETAKNLKKRFTELNVVGYQHGYFPLAEEKKIVSAIKQLNPDMLFVGLGSPRQEKWIARNLEELNVPVVIGVGGSFDIISGRLSRAPHWMHILGVEWLYRFLQEPWRIKRIVNLPIFVFRVIFSRIRK